MARGKVPPLGFIAAAVIVVTFMYFLISSSLISVDETHDRGMVGYVSVGNSGRQESGRSFDMRSNDASRIPFLPSVDYTDRPNDNWIEKTRWLDVVTAVEGSNYYRGLFALINSTFYHNKNPYLLPVRFHVVVPYEIAEQGALQKMLLRLFQNRYHLSDEAINVVGFRSEHANSTVFVSTGSNRHRNLLNYARIWLPALLPSDVRRCLYVDPDMLIRRDVTGAMAELDGSPFALGAVQVGKKKYYKTFLDFNNDIVKEAFDPNEPAFNAGVLVIDFERWKTLGMTQKIEEWMLRHKEHNLWKFGSQPPLLAAFYRQFVPIDGRWNVGGLAYSKAAAKPYHIRTAYLIHWNGPRKPWFRDLPDEFANLESHRVYLPLFDFFYTASDIDAAAKECGFHMEGILESLRRERSE